MKKRERFKELAGRLTGLSTPLGGVSWEARSSEVVVVRRVLTFLEDRRVLYPPDDRRMTDHCVLSVIDIRHYLTEEIGKLGDGSADLAANLRAMRAAGHKFLDDVGNRAYADPVFFRALGEMRGVIGIHVALLAVRYGLDVEEGLASILPPVDQE